MKPTKKLTINPDAIIGVFLCLVVVCLILAMAVELYDTTIISHDNLCNHR